MSSLSLQRRGWPRICQRWQREGQTVSGNPGVAPTWDEGTAIAIFVPTWYGRLSIGISGGPLEGGRGSCRKFFITSLLVKLQSSHCLRISMACKCLGEGCWWGGRWGHFESTVVSAPTEGLILNMQIIFSSTFPSSCCREAVPGCHFWALSRQYHFYATDRLLQGRNGVVFFWVPELGLSPLLFHGFWVSEWGKMKTWLQFGAWNAVVLTLSGVG